MKAFRKIQRFIVLTVFMACSSLAYSMSTENHPCNTLMGEQNTESIVGCKNYVLGFLEGALLTDTAIIESLESEQSDFMKRVYQTRAMRTDVRPPSTYFAKICLPEGFDKVVVVDKVLSYLSRHAQMKDGPSISVYEGFKSEYPCE